MELLRLQETACYGCGRPRIRKLNPSGFEVARWLADPGIAVRSCCTVPPQHALIVYGDSDGGVRVLRLLGDEGFDEVTPAAP
jgi:hypothetical protein